MSHPRIDFDPFGEPRPAGTTHAMLDELRERCPAFHSGARHGFWVLTRYADILAAYQDTASHSSRAIAVTDPDPSYRWIPVMLDPPEHTTWRRLLRPLFTPARAAAMEDGVRRRCGELIDALAGRGSATSSRTSPAATRRPSSWSSWASRSTGWRSSCGGSTRSCTRRRPRAGAPRPWGAWRPSSRS
ncbi:cytochrome P450 [Actinomadura sp. RB99]|uniref:cytochrome P450 n=1 Tax=Actinomadura sp. RB99 TaxID=2691577 RepID=UPI001F5110EE|nr:cytochrome P450 [Actinomadura sp. RB99]